MVKVFDAIISVMDEASKPILAIEKRLQGMGNSAAHAQLQMSAHQKLFASFGGYGSGISKSFGEVHSSMGEVGGRMAELLPMLGGLGAVGSAAGLVELVHSTAEASETLQRMAMVTGLSTQQLQAWNYIADQVGVSSDSLDRAMGRLNQRIGMALTGQAKPMAAMLKHFGISLRDSTGHVRDASTVMPQLINLFSGMKSATERNTVAQMLFGRSYQDILPILTLSQEKLKELQGQFSLFGFTLRDTDLKGLEAFNEAWKNMNAAVQGTLSDIATKLAPVLTPMIDEFSRWVSVNRDWVASGIANAVQRLGTYFDAIDWQKLGDGFSTFWTDVQKIVGLLGGLQNVMIGTGIIIGLSVLSPVLEVSLALGRLAAAIAIPIFTPLIGSVALLAVDFAKLIPTVGSLADVWAALDLAMDANPIGVLIIGLTAAAAITYEIWQHWHDILNWYNQFSASNVPGSTIDQHGNHVGPFAPRFGGRLPAIQNQSYDTNGRVHVSVDFNNAPAGTAVRAQSSGNLAPPAMRLGYNQTLNA